jgi:hypothetical protein
MEGQVPDLYAQARAACERSLRLSGELAESRRKTTESLRLIRDSRGESARLRARRQASRTGQDRLQYSAYARLQARLASLPVIEQAKGILMAQYGWPEDRALRWVSQRENIKVRDLAACVVARTVCPAPAQRRRADAAATAVPDGLVTPSSRWGSSGTKTRYRALA